MPRLSFIVPTYKPKPDVFIRHLTGIRDQAFRDWEAIYVLDGDDAEARAAIKKVFKDDARVFVHVRQHHGAQATRNFGGEQAKGEFLCFFDCDCILEPGASQMWVEQFDKKPEVGFIYSGYKFLGDKYAIDSEPFDPWTLKIRNYISGCFPMRKGLYPGWTEGLKSLQDWDMWLSVLKKAETQGMDASKLGLFVRGYAFATPFPDPESISGKGCTPDVWLERVDAVKLRHNLPERDICVVSQANRHDGIGLAKLIGADYQDNVADKPYKYKTIIQIGFSLGASSERCAAQFQKKETKKVLFWTGDNINEMWNTVCLRQIDAMAKLLNDTTIQFAEDKEAQKLLERAGFKVSVMPLPLGKPKTVPLPEQKSWAVDCSEQYGQVMAAIGTSLPDIPLKYVNDITNLSDYVGIIHFFPDRSLSSSAKRAILTGRHVISNIQQPFCGFIDDKWDVEKFIVETVAKVRQLSYVPVDSEAAGYYTKTSEKLLEAIA